MDYARIISCRGGVPKRLCHALGGPLRRRQRCDQDAEHHVAGPRVERVEAGEAVGDRAPVIGPDACGGLEAVDGGGERRAASTALDGEDGIDTVERGLQFGLGDSHAPEVAPTAPNLTNAPVSDFARARRLTR